MDDNKTKTIDGPGCNALGCLTILLFLWVLFHAGEVGALLERVVNQAFR